MNFCAIGLGRMGRRHLQVANNLGFEIVGNTPEQFTAFQAAEFARWKKVIEVGKITAD